MDISAQGWATPTSDAEAYARAGGRRRYNAVRQLQAELRRAQVARFLLATGGLRRGAQAVLARRLGVSEATISHDVQAIFGQSPKRCPLCGTAPVTFDPLGMNGLDLEGDKRT